jgi:hypothetical protein
MTLESSLKSTTIFWIYSLLPIIVITSLIAYPDVSIWWYISGSLIYAFIYRPYLNLLRVRALGVTQKYSILYIIFILGFEHYSKIHFGTMQ